jgi:hypothetical protein
VEEDLLPGAATAIPADAAAAIEPAGSAE